MTTTQQPWPANVVARYLTLAGATADVIDDATPNNRYTTHELSARCTGEVCPWDGGITWTCYTYPGDDESDDALLRRRTNLQERAQRHAETCRAMPRPEVGR